MNIPLHNVTCFGKLPIGALFSLVRESYKQTTGASLVSIRGRVWHALNKTEVRKDVIKGHPLFGRKLIKTSATVAHILGRDDERSHIVLNLSDRVAVTL